MDVVEADRATYQHGGASKNENGERVSRNRHTKQRGITYVKATDRFRTFAHRPFYQYVGTFQDLDVAVQARDAYEAQALQMLYQVIPEMAPGARNPRKIDIQMQRKSAKTVYVEFRIASTLQSDGVFCEYSDILRWLRTLRLKI